MENEILDDNSLNESPKIQKIEYGGFWIRTGATILDAIILAPLTLFAFYNTTTIKSLILAILLSTLSFLYKPLMEGMKGATLGKMACKLKIVNAHDLSPISLSNAFLRVAPWFVFFVIGLITTWVSFSHPDFQNTDDFMGLGLLAQDSPIMSIQSFASFAFFIIIIFVAFDSKKQGLHDKWSNTYVIIEPR